MRHALLAVALVPRADEINDVHRDGVGARVRDRQHLEAVRQPVFRDALDGRHVLRRDLRQRDECPKDEQRAEEHGLDHDATGAFLIGEVADGADDAGVRRDQRMGRAQAQAQRQGEPQQRPAVGLRSQPGWRDQGDHREVGG